MPVGMTDKYQPLDVGVNGILKTKMKKYYSEFLIQNINFDHDNNIIEDKENTYMHKNFTKDLVRAWKSIDIKTIKHSFDCLDS